VSTLKPDTLHTMRIDVLLWSLGGFDESPYQPDSYYSKGFPEPVLRKMMDIALRHRADYGEIRLLAESCGKSRLCISSTITRIRDGYRPGYWGVG
jgi:hypothetical protein